MFDPFFSLIRASNQLSPKTKVVDIIVLYNFYFGKISCSNEKFGAMDGQSWLKVTQIRSLCLPGWSVPRQSRRRRRHASRWRAHRRLSTPAAESIAKFDFASPFPFPSPCGARSGAEQAAARRRRSCRPNSPPLLDSPHPNPPRLTPHLQRPTPSSISQFFGRNRTRNSRPPLTLTLELHPSHRRPSSALPRAD